MNPVAPLVERVVGAVLHDEVGDAVNPELQTKTVAFVCEKMEQMPRFLGLGMMGMTAAFDMWGVVTAGRRFSRQTHEQQKRQLAQWKNAPVGLCRNFVDFYQKMGIFCYYSQLEEEHGPYR